MTVCSYNLCMHIVWLLGNNIVVIVWPYCCQDISLLGNSGIWEDTPEKEEKKEEERRGCKGARLRQLQKL